MMILRYLVAVSFVAMFFSSCLEDTCTSTRTFVQWDPVYIPESEIRPGIEMQEARELVDPGNINYYNNYLFVNERRQGVHVIDNSNPENPVNLGFIAIPGNLDMAIRNNTLYADLYLDLVAIDITDPLNATLKGRTDGVFASYYPLVEEAGYIVEYVPTERTIEVDCNDWRWGRTFFVDDQDFAFVNIAASTSGQEVISNAQGVSGSMSRFTLSKDYLYALDDYRMRVFDIKAQMPELANTVEVDWGIETLFPYGEYLFIGANAGMFILDNSNPVAPALIAEFEHAQSCDPVFVTDDIAYVTLRSGNWCQGFTNQLDVIDVSDIDDPRLIRTHQMQNPHGLSVVDETLFLCEGPWGLKVFDVEDPRAIGDNQLEHVTGLHGFDVIALDNGSHLIVVGQEGIYQYNSSDRENLVQLSMIKVNRL